MRPFRPAVARRVALAALAAAMVACSAPAFATMYKWVDKDGKVIYSDQPPPSNVKSEVIKPPPPPSNPNAAQELADKQLELKLRDKKQQDQAKTAEKTRTDNERRRENCQQARMQLRALEAGNQLFYRYDANGQPVYLDDAGRLAAVAQQRDSVRDLCQNLN
jgi:hypothetical protein